MTVQSSNITSYRLCSHIKILTGLNMGFLDSVSSGDIDHSDLLKWLEFGWKRTLPDGTIAKLKTYWWYDLDSRTQPFDNLRFERSLF